MNNIIAFLAIMAANSSYDTSTIPKKQIHCMATAVYHEARGESITGQSAVAHSILNRVALKRFPDTPCEVVYQPAQFSYIETANPDTTSPAWYYAIESAVFAYVGITADPTNGADHYYNPAKASPKWASKMIKLASIGQHEFLKHK